MPWLGCHIGAGSAAKHRSMVLVRPVSPTSIRNRGRGASRSVKTGAAFRFHVQHHRHPSLEALSSFPSGQKPGWVARVVSGAVQVVTLHSPSRLGQCFTCNVLQNGDPLAYGRATLFRTPCRRLTPAAAPFQRPPVDGLVRPWCESAPRTKSCHHLIQEVEWRAR